MKFSKFKNCLFRTFKTTNFKDFKFYDQLNSVVKIITFKHKDFDFFIDVTFYAIGGGFDYSYFLGNSQNHHAGRPSKYLVNYLPELENVHPDLLSEDFIALTILKHST